MWPRQDRYEHRLYHTVTQHVRRNAALISIYQQCALCKLWHHTDNKIVQALHCDDDHCETEESSSLDAEECEMKTAFTKT